MFIVKATYNISLKVYYESTRIYEFRTRTVARNSNANIREYNLSG